VRRLNIAIVVIALLALAGAGTGVGLAASAGASTHTPTATAATASAASAAKKTPRYVVADCFQLQVRPRSYVFTCADGNSGMENLHWTSWSSKLASAYGTYYYNDCIPYCADGHLHKDHVLAVLWGSTAVKGHPDVRRYANFTLIFTTSKRPPIYHVKNGKTYATHPVTQTFAAPPLLG
jgi:hypothetical protein